jgi:hypothetical protein
MSLKGIRKEFNTNVDELIKLIGRENAINAASSESPFAEIPNSDYVMVKLRCFDDYLKTLEEHK